MEHRGACAADGVSSDGAGIMADIPWELLGLRPGEGAVATLFLSAQPDRRRQALGIFTETFEWLGIERMGTRHVPVDVEALGEVARQSAPSITQVLLARPAHARTDAAFNAMLYMAKQRCRTRLRQAGAWLDLYFVSLSTTTVVYKALCRSRDLDRFYPDLANPRFKTRFALLHRRFSTNTRTTWDRAQPFRLVAHNGEINTITGNRSVAASRELAMGLARDELLTHDQISDSGSLNEMVEALTYRSSMPDIREVLSIMIPPAGVKSGWSRFWGRAMEPWDGPALVAYSTGEVAGARLDRNGFRPARWCATEALFCLASEAGVFELDEASITAKGALGAGSGVGVDLATGELGFEPAARGGLNAGATFDTRLLDLGDVPAALPPAARAVIDAGSTAHLAPVQALFGLTTEEWSRLLLPMVATGKEPIGSMGATARPALFSELPVSLYDFFSQRFAQVTNPPLDYLRESIVTELETWLGVRPNILDPKQLLPVAPGIRLSRPVLTLADAQVVQALNHNQPNALWTNAALLDCSFPRSEGPAGLERALARLEVEVVAEVAAGRSILVLSHAAVGGERVAVPSLLALRAAVCELNRHGARLRASVVLDVGDVRTAHQVACAIGFGAAAVCPRLALELARAADLPDTSPDEREERLVQALCQGLLKVMSKMGISVARSYHSSKLFSALGLGPGLMRTYFRKVSSPLGGLELDQLARRVCQDWDAAKEHPLDQPLASLHRLRERARGGGGEAHSMTARRARIVHKLVRGVGDSPEVRDDLLAAYEAEGAAASPVSPRHLLEIRPSEVPLPMAEVEPAEAIVRRFGSGAMSFGSISAEVQRDIFVAMRRLGGRSNSGEGGENPYYFVHGTTASTKQVASGRFGVTAEYLVSGDEIEIKIAQGAKPGEGGQLMGVKVDVHIARARHASPGMDLISPPPLHDLYSIEDLKQLIHELKELTNGHPICVKLVSGEGIGTIAVGVAKAGADVIQISGSDGGTGAATLSSMVHAGLPWELGLVEAHRALGLHGLRERVRLRVDGGLSTGLDVVMAAMLGAEEFGFGKLLLVSAGCIMARICEKNRCPTGIATQDPKFKARYKGSPENVERILHIVAEQVRALLSQLGVSGLSQLVGQKRYLRASRRFLGLIEERHIDLGLLLAPAPHARVPHHPTQPEPGLLNQRIIKDTEAWLQAGGPLVADYPITNRDRAVLASLSGMLARRCREQRMARLDGETPQREDFYPPPGSIQLTFTGSAGQGFGAFLVPGVAVRLIGEGNDSVCKSMSGGEVVVVPPPAAGFAAHEHVIIGNGALYGATGGRLLVSGRAGDRFGVRNSGAVAVVEGAGLHCCEYMTGGTVLVLGRVGHNAGAGMTGGVLYLPTDGVSAINPTYVNAAPLTEADLPVLLELLGAHRDETGSETAARLLAEPRLLSERLLRVAPV